MSSNTRKYKLGDEVSARLVQIFQEAMLTGCDGADLLRQVELTEGNETYSGSLKLTDEYKELVKKSHEQLLKNAEKLSIDRDTHLAGRTVIKFTESDLHGRFIR